MSAMLIYGIYQYVNVFQVDLAGAYTAKSANGHSWNDMECSNGLCVTTDSKVGIGTDSPTTKLQVSGVIRGTDVCNDAGYCLSSLTGLTNACGTAAKTYQGTDTAYAGTYCLMGIPTPNPPVFPGQGETKTWTCPVPNGTPINCSATRNPSYLVNSVHTEPQCLAAGGTVVSSNVASNQCKFVASSCPSGWTQYLNYSKTISQGPNAASGTVSCGISCPSCPGGQMTGYHAWSNTAVEVACVSAQAWCSMEGNCYCTCSSCNYLRTYCHEEGCTNCWWGTTNGAPTYAAITEIGCY